MFFIQFKLKPEVIKLITKVENMEGEKGKFSENKKVCFKFSARQLEIL